MSTAGEADTGATAAPPPCATEAVLAAQGETPDDAVFVKGHDFNGGTDGLLSKYMTMGFQGTNLGKAIEEINRVGSLAKGQAFLRLQGFLFAFGARMLHSVWCMLCVVWCLWHIPTFRPP